MEFFCFGVGVNLGFCESLLSCESSLCGLCVGYEFLGSGCDSGLGSYKAVIFLQDGLVLHGGLDGSLHVGDLLGHCLTLEVVLHVGAVGSDGFESGCESVLKCLHLGHGLVVGFLACGSCGAFILESFLCVFGSGNQSCDVGGDTVGGSHHLVVVGGKGTVLISLFDSALESLDLFGDLLTLEVVLHVWAGGVDLSLGLGQCGLELGYLFESCGVCVAAVHDSVFHLILSGGGIDGACAHAVVAVREDPVCDGHLGCLGCEVGRHGHGYGEYHTVVAVEAGYTVEVHGHEAVLGVIEAFCADFGVCVATVAQISNAKLEPCGEGHDSLEVTEDDVVADGHLQIAAFARVDHQVGLGCVAPDLY